MTKLLANDTYHEIFVVEASPLLLISAHMFRRFHPNIVLSAFSTHYSGYNSVYLFHCCYNLTGRSVFRDTPNHPETLYIILFDGSGGGV